MLASYFLSCPFLFAFVSSLLFVFLFYRVYFFFSIFFFSFSVSFFSSSFRFCWPLVVLASLAGAGGRGKGDETRGRGGEETYRRLGILFFDGRQLRTEKEVFLGGGRVVLHVVPSLPSGERNKVWWKCYLLMCHLENVIKSSENASCWCLVSAFASA